MQWKQQLVRGKERVDEGGRGCQLQEVACSLRRQGDAPGLLGAELRVHLPPLEVAFAPQEEPLMELQCEPRQEFPELLIESHPAPAVPEVYISALF